VKKIYHNINENLKTNDDFSIERKYQRAHSYESETNVENHRRKRAGDQALELEKHMKWKVGSGRGSRKSVEVVELETNETIYFPSLLEASKYYGKTKNYFIYNNGKVWENRKITIIYH